MRKTILVGVLMLALSGGVSCTNMNKTQQGAVSGMALGGLAGAGIAAIAGGYAGWGALAGAAAGGLAGGIIGHEQSKR